FQISGESIFDQIDVIRVDVSKSFKTLHLNLEEKALPGQCLQPFRHSFFRLTEVIWNPFGEGNPKGAHRSKGKCAVKFFARGESGIIPVWQDALPQIIDALEILATGDHGLAGQEH